MTVIAVSELEFTDRNYYLKDRCSLIEKFASDIWLANEEKIYKQQNRL